MKKVFLMLSIAFVISSCGKKNELEPSTSKADSIATKEIKTDTVPSFTKELSLNKISFKIVDLLTRWIN